MFYVRPTVQVLKALQKGGKLPTPAAKRYRSARSSSVEESVRLDLLVKVIDIACRDVALLQDANNRFARGFPDQHRSMTKHAGEPVYEVRDFESPAWRGAIVCTPGTSGWLIHVDRHDQFHHKGPNVIKGMVRRGELSPSKLDHRLRELAQRNHDDQTNRRAMLESILSTLNKALHNKSAVQVQMPPVSQLEHVNMQLQLDRVNDTDDISRDPLNAHHKQEMLRLEMTLATVTDSTRHWLLRTCIPFLQSDNDMVESVYRKDLTVQILITRARLIQLLATARTDLPTQAAQPPVPKVLHYTAKTSLAEAFVRGIAVQAVCGQWWVPIGDEVTHSDLPVCADCESEAPFAETVRNAIQ